MSSDATADIRATADATGDHGGESRVAAAHPVAVKGGAAFSVTVVLLALLVASVAVFLMSAPQQHQRRQGDRVGHEYDKQKLRAGEPVEHAVGEGGVPPGFNSRVDAFRTWARLAWMKLRRPAGSGVDETRYGDEQGSAAGTVAGAAKKSFESGKETVEQAAAAAGKATRETVEATKEKARRAAFAADDDNEEL